MKQISNIYSLLDKQTKEFNNPMVESIAEEFNHDIFKIIVATLLSARTKDELTYEILTTKFFKKIKTVSDLEKISLKDLEKLIYPIGFYKNKAKFLKKFPIVLKEEFKGIFPKEIDELIKLPGVGRKTANLVQSIGYNIPAICVDIHVHRITNRIGLVKTKTPLETEMTLRKILPIKFWTPTNYYFVLHGKNICKPINPNCEKCLLTKHCDYYTKNK